MNPFEAARRWCERCCAAGWFGDEVRRRFEDLEDSGAADLFDQPTRPLVVGLFGGTGVGKSSLLNRLAGERVAPVGVERPTSRELIVYAHVSAPLGERPERLPADRLHVHRHDEERWRGVVWIDAPDIDSVSAENREAAMAWLPHIDLLIYVVSPERYRDDVGWRVLSTRSHRHGWMFVMNHWDEGVPEQREDLRRVLVQAGFADALLFCTSCPPRTGEAALPSADEFHEVQASVESLLEEHAVRELDRLGREGRLRTLAEAVEEARERIGNEERWQKAEADWRARWRRGEEEIRAGLEWPIRSLAARFANSGGWPADSQPRPADDRQALGLWDEWAVQRIGVTLDETERNVRRSGLAAVRLRSELDSAASSAAVLVDGSAQAAVRAALAHPGGVFRRATRRMMRFSRTALPLAAVSWVGFTVVARYYRAGLGESSYLDGNFAIHSALLVLISWAVPYGLDRLLRPDVEQTALRALRRGAGEGIAELGARLAEAAERTAGEARHVRREAGAILEAIAGEREEAGPAGLGRVLDRVLATGKRDREV